MTAHGARIRSVLFSAVFLISGCASSSGAGGTLAGGTRHSEQPPQVAGQTSGARPVDTLTELKTAVCLVGCRITGELATTVDLSSRAVSKGTLAQPVGRRGDLIGEAI